MTEENLKKMIESQKTKAPRRGRRKVGEAPAQTRVEQSVEVTKSEMSREAKTKKRSSNKTYQKEKKM